MEKSFKKITIEKLKEKEYMELRTLLESEEENLNKWYKVVKFGAKDIASINRFNSHKINVENIKMILKKKFNYGR